jgi:hypothetical protein
VGVEKGLLGSMGVSGGLSLWGERWPGPWLRKRTNRLQDLDRIYITDGGAGLLRIYDGQSYEQIKVIDQLPDADSIAYGPVTKYLYVTTGGEDTITEHWDEKLIEVPLQ